MNANDTLRILLFCCFLLFLINIGLNSYVLATHRGKRQIRNILHAADTTNITSASVAGVTVGHAELLGNLRTEKLVTNNFQTDILEIDGTVATKEAVRSIYNYTEIGVLEYTKVAGRTQGKTIFWNDFTTKGSQEVLTTLKQYSDSVYSKFFILDIAINFQDTVTSNFSCTLFGTNYTLNITNQSQKFSNFCLDRTTVDNIESVLILQNIADATVDYCRLDVRLI